MCSCGGNKDKESGGETIHNLERNYVHMAVSGNGVKKADVGKSGSMGKEGEYVRLKHQFESCDYDNETAQSKCWTEINGLMVEVMVTEIVYDNRPFTDINMQCMLTGKEEVKVGREIKKCKKRPKLKCASQVGNKICDSPPIDVKFITKKEAEKTAKLKRAREKEEEKKKKAEELENKKQKIAKKESERRKRALEYVEQKASLVSEGKNMAGFFVANCDAVASKKDMTNLLECQRIIKNFDDRLNDTLHGDNAKKEFKDAEDALENCTGFIEDTSSGGILSHFKHDRECAKERENFYDIKYKNDEITKVIVAVVREINEEVPGFMKSAVKSPDFVNEAKKTNFLRLLLEKEDAYLSFDDFTLPDDFLSWTGPLRWVKNVLKGRIEKSKNLGPKTILWLDNLPRSGFWKFINAVLSRVPYTNWAASTKGWAPGTIKNSTGLVAALSLTISNFWSALWSPDLLLLILGSATISSFGYKIPKIVNINLSGIAGASVMGALQSVYFDENEHNRKYVHAINLAQQSAEHTIVYLAYFGVGEVAVGTTKMTINKLKQNADDPMKEVIKAKKNMETLRLRLERQLEGGAGDVAQQAGDAAQQAGGAAQQAGGAAQQAGGAAQQAGDAANAIEIARRRLLIELLKGNELDLQEQIRLKRVQQPVPLQEQIQAHIVQAIADGGDHHEQQVQAIADGGDHHEQQVQAIADGGDHHEQQAQQQAQQPLQQQIRQKQNLHELLFLLGRREEQNPQSRLKRDLKEMKALSGILDPFIQTDIQITSIQVQQHIIRNTENPVQREIEQAKLLRMTERLTEMANKQIIHYVNFFGWTKGTAARAKAAWNENEGRGRWVKNWVGSPLLWAWTFPTTVLGAGAFPFKLAYLFYYHVLPGWIRTVTGAIAATFPMMIGGALFTAITSYFGFGGEEDPTAKLATKSTMARWQEQMTKQIVHNVLVVMSNNTMRNNTVS